MTHRLPFLLGAITTGLVIGACSDTTSPIEGNSAASLSAAAPRSGALHVTKDCSTYTGQAGDICTITSSNVKAIEVGSRVIYASAAVGVSLDTDVRLDLPGPGNNSASGHCTLSLATGVGVCTFSGGTGKFRWFEASAAVSNVGGPNFAWDGTYSLSPRD